MAIEQALHDREGFARIKAFVISEKPWKRGQSAGLQREPAIPGPGNEQANRLPNVPSTPDEIRKTPALLPVSNKLLLCRAGQSVRTRANPAVAECVGPRGQTCAKTTAFGVRVPPATFLRGLWATHSLAECEGTGTLVP